jgi:uncharacterized lipoprotein YajG
MAWLESIGTNIMTIKLLFAILAATLLTVASIPQWVETSPIAAPAVDRIVDLPTVTVRPAAQDAAYYQAHRIVDLAVIIVYADAADQASFLADTALRASLACRC